MLHPKLNLNSVLRAKSIMRVWVLLGLLALVVSGCVVPAAAPEANNATGAAQTSTEPAETEATADNPEGGASAEAAPETVTVSHAQGETTVVRNPQTVVVFDYSALDTLDQLGVPVAAVPQGTLPPFLAHYGGTEYVNAGTLFEPDYEAVNALAPDLIIAGGRSSTVYGELSEIAPTIDVTIDEENFLESYKAVATMLGAIFGQDDAVATRLAEIDQAVTDLNRAAQASDKNALIVMTSGGKVTAYGPGSRFGMIHGLMGVKPVVEDIEAATHGDAISFEFIAEHDPDILFIIDRDSAIGQGTEAAEQVMDNELIHNTTAWSTDSLVYLDSATWYLANSGLGTFPAMVAEIAGAFE